LGGSKRALSVRPKRTWRAVAPKRSSTHATIQRFEPNACAGSVWFGVWVAITNGVPSAAVRPSRLVSEDASSDHATIGAAAAPPNTPSPTPSAETTCEEFAGLPLLAIVRRSWPAEDDVHVASHCAPSCASATPTSEPAPTAIAIVVASSTAPAPETRVPRTSAPLLARSR
jgi:hypothetical protein